MKGTQHICVATNGSVLWNHRVSTNSLLKIKILVRVALLLLLAGACLVVHAQTNEWVWMGGSSDAPRLAIDGYGPDQHGQAGVYGTLGVPASGNIPGGRYSASVWTDSSGNVWLFGGWGVDSSSYLGILNDLWEFSPSTNKWTWMSGSNSVPCQLVENQLTCGGQPGTYGTIDVPAAGNTPGARYSAVNWIDEHGNLWLFGGDGFDSNDTEGSLNDLWEYKPSTNQWTWMGGSSAVSCKYCGPPGVYGTLGVSGNSNVPGGRSAASSWTDMGGNFWLFGGSGYDSTDTGNFLNDLWEYSPSAGEWTWMGGKSAEPCTTVDGQSFCGQPGVYGTLGVAATTNFPGSREDASNSIDGNGDFWLFGGFGLGSTGGPSGNLNDLWEFNPSKLKWTWMGGSSVQGSSWLGQTGVYGTLGVAAPGNVIGARGGSSRLADGSGNLWIFGGAGVDSTGTNWGVLNELWEFTPSTGEWAWVSGSSTVPGTVDLGQLGVYGTLGVPAAANIPGGRESLSSWTDAKGDFWLFGGSGFTTDSSGNAAIQPAFLNDLWEYSPLFPIPPATTPSFSLAGGTYTSDQTVTISDAITGATIYYTTDGTTPTTSSTEYSNPINVAKTETLKAIAVAASYTESTVASAKYIIQLPVKPTMIWTTPAAITFGTALSALQLDASATVAGNFVYTPAAGTVLSGGIYTLSVTFTPTDTTDYTTVTATVQLMVNQAAPTVTVAPSSSSITTAQPLSVTVHVSDGSGNPIPTGTVKLTGGGYTSAAINLISGAATFNIAAWSLNAGGDTLTASYTADVSSSADYSSASGTASVTVTAAPRIATAVTAAPSSTVITNKQSDTVAITVSGSDQGTPAGTVTLSSGSYSAEQTLSGGTASFTIPAGALSIGADTLTAAYSGAGAYAGSTVTTVITVSQVVITSPSPSAVTPGQSASATVTLAASSTYSGTINMSCSLTSSPAGAQSPPTCSINPTSITVGSGASGTAFATVQTTGTSTSTFVRPSHLELWGLGSNGAVLACFFLLGIPARRRRWFSMLVLLCVLGAAGVIGCGGTSTVAKSTETTAGTYSFTITGTDSVNSTITASTTDTITVN